MKHLKKVTIVRAGEPLTAMALLEKEALVRELEQGLTQLTALAQIGRNLKDAGGIH
jgi:hypothetical protein